jgi:hypothetical protein
MKHYNNHWFHDSWRPALAWLYGFICAFDFVFGPLVYFWVQQFETSAANDAYREWKPLTLQGGGIFHLSMCAVLGVSAYGRTQEKMGVIESDRIVTKSETIRTNNFMPNPNERAPL